MDISFYRENGYQLIRNFFPRGQILQLKEYLKEEAERTLKEIHSQLPFSDYDDLTEQVAGISRDEKAFSELTPRLKQVLSGHYPLEVRLSDPIMGLFKTKALKDLYKTVFPGQAPKAHLPPVVRFVIPNNHFAAVPPHQDISYNRHMDDFFTLWTPFVPIDSLCGGVEVYEGTQHMQAQITEDLSSNVRAKFWHDGVATDCDPVHFEMNVTDILILNKYILHRSRANISNEIRMSADFRFFKTRSKKHYLKLESFETVDPTGV